jgi:ribosomal protein S18 acetylase RimI-like enzyme
MAINEKIMIRAFNTGDKPLVDEFFAQMGAESKAFFNRGGGNYNFAMRFFNGTAKSTDYFLAEYDGKMVGYVYLWDMDTLIPWLGIAVHDAYKGMGMGRKLMDHMISHAKNHNKGGILLTTHIANLRGQSLYENCGFNYLGVHTSGEKLYLLRFAV